MSKCPKCGYDPENTELDRAIDEDATAYRVDVLPLREPVDPDSEVLRAEIGPRP